MKEYTLEDSSLYTIYNICDKPIIVFDDHNMALPVWGTFSSRNNFSFNLVTFDYHTDTHPPFNSYLIDLDVDRIPGNKVLDIPVVKQLLDGCHLSFADFSFEDIYKLSCSILKNTEHILTACALGYLKSYTIIHRDDAWGYEDDDRFNGLDARYIESDIFATLGPLNASVPIALDFDLDYFRSEDDLSDGYFEKISYLVKNASIITIAREPKYFEACKSDPKFSLCQSEELLINGLKTILNQ